MISFRSALIVAVCSVLGSVTLSILLAGHAELQTAAGDGLAVLVDLLAALALFYAARRSAMLGRSVALAWTVLALGQLTHTVGDILWSITEIVYHQAPFPSAADGWFIAQYPVFALGILLLPRTPLTSGEKLKVLLDMGVVTIASVMLFWFLLIEPIIQSTAGSDAYTLTLTVAYPVMDLLLLFAVIELLFRRISGIQSAPIMIFAGGTAVMILTDLVFFSQSLLNTYDSGGLLDTGWIAAYSMVGLAGVMQADLARRDSSGQRWAQAQAQPLFHGAARSISQASRDSLSLQFTWPYYLPYVGAAAAYVLLQQSYDHFPAQSISFISWGVGGIIGLIIIRQIVALHENQSLYREAKQAEEEVRRLNSELEMRVLERTSELEQANRELQSEIQDRKRIEEDLMAAKQAAEEASRVKTEFLANMSHELRTPLNAVVGMTGLLLRTKLDSEQRDCARTIGSSSSALLSIINDILDYSRIDTGKMKISLESFDLRRCMEDALDQVISASDARQKGLEVKLSLEKSAPQAIVADREKLRQVLVNLLSNAVKFTKAGRIELSASGRGLKAPIHQILFAVKDSGIGIPPDKMDRLFQSFSQVDSSITRRYGGTGLGLAISKRLVELMGGRIWVQSQPGAGSTFFFEIPAEEAWLSSEGEAGEDEEDGSRDEGNKSGDGRGDKLGNGTAKEPQKDRKPSLSILIAEDNLINQMVMLRMLKKMGYSADVAGNGKEVLQALQRRFYQLILMDVQMPEMDGLQAARAIRNLSTPAPQPKIIAVTAHALEGDREQCLAAGMDGYISKPVKWEDLQSILRSFEQGSDSQSRDSPDDSSK